jgi:BASS family bile acid:Na+ symporter
MLDNPLVTILAPATVFALMLSNGINIVLDDLLSVWSRPALLARALLAVIILVPAAVVLILLVGDLPPAIVVGMAILAAAPGAPLTATRSTSMGGSIHYAAGLQLTLVALAVVTTPLMVAIFCALFATGSEIRISALAVTRQIAIASFLPVGLGVLIQKFLPRVTQRIGAPLRILANLLLLVLVLVALVPSVRLKLQLGIVPILAIAIMAAAALAIGHLLGRPADPQVRASIATACIARNLGLVLFIGAVNGLLPDLVPTVVAYMILGALVSIPYALWVRRQLRHASPPEAASAPA